MFCYKDARALDDYFLLFATILNLDLEFGISSDLQMSYDDLATTLQGLMIWVAQFSKITNMQTIKQPSKSPHPTQWRWLLNLEY